MERSVYILGIYGGHNATAALLKDGEVVGAVSEERFNGEKNYVGFPYKSVEYLLDMAGIGSDELALIVTPVELGVPGFTKGGVKKFISIFYFPLNLVRKIWTRVEYYLPFLHLLGRKLHEFLFHTIGRYAVRKHMETIADFLNVDVVKVRAFDHHKSHAAAAYYGSPYSDKEALVLTIDGEGDLASSTVNLFNGTKYRRLAKTDSDCSFGCMYYEVTGYLGMKRGEHEYKVMGLAPYAKDYGIDEVYEKIEDLIILDPKNPLRFKSKIDTHPAVMELYLKDVLKGYRFDNIAGAFQRLVEKRLTEWAKAAVEKTGVKTVCIGGGVAMNIKANMRIAQLDEVEEFFVCPSSGDESTAIGACYLGHIDYCKKKDISMKTKSLESLYLGPEFSDTQIEDYLIEGDFYDEYDIIKCENIEKELAKLLSEFKIIGHLSGRMEWGARALGHRSILANPSSPDLVRVINEQMKMRDFWMPFACSILKERAADYVVNPKNIPANYMALGFESTDLARKDLRAGMHPYDFTIRPQLVDSSISPKYHKIIKSFEEITGIGGLLNTSFNLHGLPIVLGPKEAMYAFENSGLEYLAMGNFLIKKRR